MSSKEKALSLSDKLYQEGFIKLYGIWYSRAMVKMPKSVFHHILKYQDFSESIEKQRKLESDDESDNTVICIA